jgi:hypothetical protein
MRKLTEYMELYLSRCFTVIAPRRTSFYIIVTRKTDLRLHVEPLR